jgi:ATP-dependent DNA ligase
MLLRPTFAFIPPALPSPAERVPIGGGWIHEIKHDGYRLISPARPGRRTAAHALSASEDETLKLWEIY